ncbi:MAG TPA: ribonuclease Z [Thermococcus paralvinellae]|uniref:Ribonuclease Z n=1 Tax=Thermococcus paralvinellae TaxID=582419 RepID=A0A832Z8F8_9EURY|nr:ribonuclease Z [Thermococcus paralvinellae]
MLEVIFLGTGGIMPNRERNVPSIVLRYKGEIILWDVGEGTLRQLNTAKLSPMRIEKVFITHFHGDHYLGLMSLIQTMTLWNRENPLHIYGPKYTFEFIQNYLKSGFFAPSFEIHVHELGETRLKFGDYEIWAFKVEHGIPALGYVFKEKDRRGNFDLEKIRELGLKPGPWMKELELRGKIDINGQTIYLEDVTGERRKGVKVVYTGDTEPCARIELFSERADLLIHEATYLSDEERGESYHSTVSEACEVARKAKVKLLALFHRAPRYEYDEYLQKARQLCNHRFMVPKDFDKITLNGEGYDLSSIR